MQALQRGHVRLRRAEADCRDAFTLIELLVVMAIIALLASLLFPAIQRVREGGRRTQCLSNMHQLAIASHDYEGSYRTLPSGWITDFSGPPDIQLQVTQPIQLQIANNQRVSLTDYVISEEWGFHSFMLQQIEEPNLVPDWNLDKSDQNNTANWQKIQFPIEVYVCPSASLPTARPSSLGYTSYRGNLGYWPDNNMPLDNGPFYANSHVELSRDFQDGTTHTLLFGETLFGFWGDAYSCCARFRDDHAQPNYFDQYWPGANQGMHFFGFGSFHGDLVNFVFADGRQASIPKNTDRIVLQAIATRNGGEPERFGGQ
jgi:prepilin-type N-terminal cleavage/methylation domain-containing protein